MNSIEKYASRLSEVRSLIGQKSSVLTPIAQESTNAAQSAKNETLLNLSVLFAGLGQLASSLEGDFDAISVRSPKKERARTALNDLTSKADAVVKSSDQAAERDVNIRTELGGLRKQITDLKEEIATSRQQLEVEQGTQREKVNAARGNSEVAEKAYKEAQRQFDDAQRNKNSWNKAQDNLPGWVAAIPVISVPVLFSKGVMGIGQAVTSVQLEGQRKNFDSQKAFYQVQVSHLEQLEVALRHSESSMLMVNDFGIMVESITKQCEGAISLCQASEAIILQAKTSLNSILGKCKYVQELVGRSEYTETKEDYIGVILESLLYGAFDRALEAPATSVLQIVKRGDATHLLTKDPFDKQLVAINAILSGLSGLVVLSQ